MAAPATAMSQLLTSARTVGAVEVVGASLYFYDYALTIADEIEFVWRRKWGAGTIIYLLARYLVVPELFLTLYNALINPANVDCRMLNTYAIWSLWLGMTAADGILILRTWAIWDTRLPVLAALCAVLCTKVALGFYVAVVFARGLDPVPLYPGISYHFCATTARNDSVGIYWIAVASFDLLIFMMTITKGIRYLRERTGGVVKTLYRDGILYFTFIFSISAANVILIYGGGTRADPAYILLLGLLQSSLHSVLSCRLVLHIRSSVARALQVSLSTIPSAP